MGIIDQDTDIVVAGFVEMGQQSDDAGLEYLATDQADFGILRGLPCDVLAATEADFKPDLTRRYGENAGGTVGGDRSDRRLTRRQPGFEPRLLAWAQFVAASPAMQTIAPPGKAGRIFTHFVRTLL